MKFTKRHAIMTLFCVYIAAIFILCFMKGDNIPDMQLTLFGIPTDKLVHFSMFAPYPILAFMSFYPKNATSGRELMLLTALVVLGSGLAYGTERLQGLTDYRAYEIADFHADMIGLAAGTLPVLIYILFRRK